MSGVLAQVFLRIGVAMFIVLLTQSASRVQADAGTMGPADAASIPFVDKAVDTDAGRTARYEVFVPRRWNAAEKWPVILFLHGSGERGTDGAAETKNGIRLLIGQDPANFPCVVVCPQCQPGRTWTSVDQQILALRALNDAIREYNGDPTRQYLTGLSLGGYGTWSLARQYPMRWAAIAPVCGGVIYPGPNGTTPRSTVMGEPDPYKAEAERVARLPIWVFHGGSDPVVPVTESRQLVADLKGLGADVRYNEYAGVGHSSWDNAYAEPGLLPWMLSHRTGGQ